MKDETIEINKYQCRVISSKGKGTPIIFLHGYMYTSDVWNEIGLLRILEQYGIPFKAIDMPYGKISECTPRTSSSQDNVELVAAIAGKDPVIVGASLGGYIALKYSVDHPVKGLLLAAPVMCLQEELTRHYERLENKVSIVYGDADNIVPANEMKKFSGLVKTDLQIYKNAGHPAYLDFPERFNEDVLAMYKTAIG